MALCNYGPACSFTAHSHSNTRGDAELCAAAQQTARSTLAPHCSSASPHAIPRLPTTKGHAFLPYHSPATSHSAVARHQATSLVHSITIDPAAVSSN